MNTAPVLPARIVVDADGTPRSAEYGDIYHPRAGALAQARHVFLAEGAIAARWRDRERFVVLETGFGLGNNFLATWAAWRSDPRRCSQLHFVSIEQSPPTGAQMASIARDPSLAPLAAELAARWPPLTCNLHRIAFEAGAVELLLAFGAAGEWLRQLVADVDAFFLDGFAPAVNPAMWEPRLLKSIARLAVPDASVATWSAARSVRDGLASAGFEVERAAGSEGKRDITRARFAPRFPPKRTARRADAIVERSRVTARAHVADVDVAIVGAGLAGCATAVALARRGVSSLVVERHGDVAREASGNAAAVFHGVVHRSDGRHARFHRAAALAAAYAVGDAIARHRVAGSVGGLLRLETQLDLAAMRAIVAEQGLPDDYVAALDAEAASRIAGVALARPAWHYPAGGWVDPRGLALAWLADAGQRAQLRLGADVRSLRRSDDCWLLEDANGAVIVAARTVALCDGSGGRDLLGPDAWPIRRQRGQLGAIAAETLGDVPRVPVAGHGHVVAAADGTVWFGTSTAFDDADRSLRAPDDARNRERLALLLGRANANAAGAPEGRVGFRWVSDDRLPIVGAVPAAVAAHAIAVGAAPSSRRLDQPRFIARAPGLFVLAALGSRGVASAALGAEVLAATIVGSPVPAERDLIDAIDPARFESRAFRRSEAARQRAAAGLQPPVGPIAGSFGA